MQNNTWFTSDTHYNHKNIVRGTTSWDTSNFTPGSSHQSVRDFNTLEEHNDELVDRINSLVKEDDTLWHLGDWSFGGHQSIKIFRERLRCKNIHLIFGNHDQHIEPIDSPYRKLFSSVQYVKEFSLKHNFLRREDTYIKQKFFLSHYSHQVWNQSHHGTIHLFGHSHGSIQGIGRSMDVGVDTHNLYPYHLDEILDIMKEIPVTVVDHHNQNTN
jgi:calcineurin-like phosphoesterase family protein